jgi:flavin-dependent thymidylate synthase
MFEQLHDVAFNRHSMNEDGKHSSPEILNDNAIDYGVEGIEVRLVQGINEDDFKNVMSIATRATTGVDPELPDERLWDEMLKGGLQTALETQTVIFLVTGCSRALTHQLVRTRKASFHQQSQRATFMGDEFNVRIPRSIMLNEDVLHKYVSAIRLARYAYSQACEADIAYQDARYILPEGSETQILCEYPLREFLNVYAYRACYMFLWEMVSVMREMGRLLVEAHPWLEPHVKISCEKSKRCTFMGWEEVDDQCEFEWGPRG